jgi:TetR/AcrR family acrAB operon transcriptional repressor
MARSTKQEALETRCRILDSAEAVFHENGVTRTSLADIALAAKVTRGAIYWHFKNKADLFNAMCERVRLPMEAMVEQNDADNDHDALEKLRHGCLFAIGQIVHNPQTRKVFDIMFHKCEFVASADPIWRRQQLTFRNGTRNIERLLQSACKAGQLPENLDVQLAAINLHALVYGLINNWLFAPGSFDLGGQAEALINAGFDTLRYAPSLRLQRA